MIHCHSIEERVFIMGDKFTNENSKRFTLRIDKDLFRQITESARKNKRSITKEIEYFLRKYYRKELK